SKAARETVDAILQAERFTDIAEYQKALLTEEEMEKTQKNIEEYTQKTQLLHSEIAQLIQDTEGKQLIEMNALEEEKERVKKEKEEVEAFIKENQGRILQNRRIEKDLLGLTEGRKEREKEFVEIKNLSDTANGDLTGKVRITFETYLQTAYFDQILHAANQRLLVMTGQRYRLLRREEEENLRSQRGLELDVIDQYTGKMRDVRTLSGGEAFQASLCLALGMGDVVQQYAGGVQMETMFIDEGFGSLDAEALDMAIKTLQNLAGENKLIGIISHVEELKERIEKKIVVTQGSEGSRLTIEEG
ncbi:MAG: SMC family ATPase, partial [Clostridiales bacterium]|nr:SMC family ATPase [Clostridiales bacterium]